MMCGGNKKSPSHPTLVCQMLLLVSIMMIMRIMIMRMIRMIMNKRMIIIISKKGLSAMMIMMTKY